MLPRTPRRSPEPRAAPARPPRSVNVSTSHGRYRVVSHSGTSSSIAARNPAGTAAPASRRTGPAAGSHQRSGAAVANTSTARSIDTPVPGIAASPTSRRNVAAAQPSTRSRGSARKYHTAAATADVVAGGPSRAQIATSARNSCSSTAVVSPTTPAPITSASGTAGAARGLLGQTLRAARASSSYCASVL